MNEPIQIDNKAYIIALCEEAERLGLDIAPNYQPDYLSLAFAISHEMGEQGRQIFHRFCRLSTKYDERNADKKFTQCLAKNSGRVTVGTVVHLCKYYGMDTDAVRQRLIERQKDMRKLPSASCVPFTSFNSFKGVLPKDEEGAAQEVSCETDPKTPLPTFGRLNLPYPLDLIYSRGQTPEQSDAMLLAALAVIGTAMDWHVRTKYSDFYQYPCLQLFVMAPSASGKGAIARVRQLADPIHDERVGRLPLAEAQYAVDMARWQEETKNLKVGEHPRPKPQKPVRELFLIPGNNTGTGILQNIIDSHGNGLIFEAEADTVSTAITGDYGHWSDTLRKAFDHDRLSYNRRTDREYKDLKAVRLGVVMSGTPQQLAPLIPSAENGLFSRHIFYYIPHGRVWIDQFDHGGGRTDNTTFFDQLAEQLNETLRKIKAKGIIELVLTEDQMADFNSHFSSFFREGQLALNGELDSTVIRQAINAVRIMSIVAVLREYEKHGGEHLEDSHRPARTPEGGEANLYYLSISDDDFIDVLGIFESLYQHSIHILSFLKSSETERRVLSEKMLLLGSMPDEFTRQLWVEACQQNGINANTADTWLKRLKEQKVINAGDERGTYTKEVKIREKNNNERNG